MQKVDISLMLWKYEGDLKLNPGMQSLKYELYIDGKRYYEHTSFYLLPHQFDEQKQEVVDHPKAKFINAIVGKKLKQYQDEILKKIALDEDVTPEIFDRNSKKGGFFDFCRAVRKDKVTTTMTGRMERFLLREPLFKDINIDFLRKYEQWHYDEELHPNTLHQSMKYMRRICNQARDENYIRKNPWKKEGGAYKMPEYVQPERIFLNEQERGRFWDLFLKYKHLYVANNEVYDDKYKTLVYFMLACFTGFRHSDWGQFDPATRVQEDGMIRLQPIKNKTWVVMEVGSSLEMIIAEIRKIGPFTLNNSDTNDLLRILAKEAKVNKDITTHVGRHSFGYLCASYELSVEDTAYFMGISVKTAKVYYHQTGQMRKERAKKLAQA